MSDRRDLALGTFTPLVAAGPYLSRQESAPGLSLAQLFAIVWAYRRVSLAIVATVLTIAAIACAVMPRTWEATAALMVDLDVNDPLSGREFPSGLLGTYMSTQVELARGPQVLQAVVARLKLTDEKRYTAGYDGEAPGLAAWAASRVARRLTVEQGKYGSQLIYVKYAAPTAEEASRIANTVAEVYAEQQHERQTGPAAERAQRYSVQLAELKNKVGRAQEEVTAFRQRSGLIDSDEKGDVGMLMLSSLEARLLEVQNQRRAAEARALTDTAVGSQVLASPMVQSLKTQLALHTSSLAQLRTSLGTRHPQVIELQSQIAATQRALDAELQAYSSNAAAELKSAVQLEEKLQKALEERRARVLQVRSLQDAGAKQQLELDSAQEVYKRALEGYDQVLFASSGGYSNIGFVSRAEPPPRPSKPKVALLMLLATGFAGVLALAAPLVWEFLHRRVRCRDDVERDHGVPVLIELGPLPITGPYAALTAA